MWIPYALEDKHVQLWIETLTNAQQDEFARLMRDIPAREAEEEIIKDWVEEHGGEREWVPNVGMMDYMRPDDRVRRPFKYLHVPVNCLVTKEAVPDGK